MNGGRCRQRVPPDWVMDDRITGIARILDTVNVTRVMMGLDRIEYDIDYLNDNRIVMNCGNSYVVFLGDTITFKFRAIRSVDFERLGGISWIRGLVNERVIEVVTHTTSFHPVLIALDIVMMGYDAALAHEIMTRFLT